MTMNDVKEFIKLSEVEPKVYIYSYTLDEMTTQERIVELIKAGVDVGEMETIGGTFIMRVLQKAYRDQVELVNGEERIYAPNPDGKKVINDLKGLSSDGVLG